MSEPYINRRISRDSLAASTEARRADDDVEEYERHPERGSFNREDGTS